MSKNEKATTDTATDKAPAPAAGTEAVTTTDVVTASTTATDPWGEPDKTTKARYRTVKHGDQVRVHVLTKGGRSANVLVDDERAGVNALAAFVAEEQ